jgi:trehalose 6-phosphate phosphatase
MAGVEGAAYAANHGLQLWVDGESRTAPSVQAYVDEALAVASETASLAFDGLVVENKGPGLAFHYRLASDEAAAREMIFEALRVAPSASHFAVHEGRKVIELRPPLEIDKGTALAELARLTDCRSILCVGDDATDIDMFRAARGSSGSGIPALAIAVTSEETPASLLGAADYAVEGVPGVEWLLGELLKAVSSR